LKNIDFKALSRPFELDDLEWRTLRVMNYDKLQAMIVPYVTARAIQDRLDDVCKPDKWWNQFSDWKDGQLCGITIVTDEIARETVTKWDGARDTKIEALKGGLSDSMKRAAVQWGIGRYLYTLPPMKAQILEKWEPGAYKGEYKKNNNDPKRTTFWWKPNTAAINAIEESQLEK